jgi:hypothetical protein
MDIAEEDLSMWKNSTQLSSKEDSLLTHIVLSSKFREVGI